MLWRRLVYLLFVPFFCCLLVFFSPCFFVPLYYCCLFVFVFFFGGRGLPSLNLSFLYHGLEPCRISFLPYFCFCLLSTFFFSTLSSPRHNFPLCPRAVCRL
ncbi:hypothetical protein, unlikely [Trypanosoma brucei gambiense DAL972]|uniref:Uncharacterized protein n=1 Tax=Trypanosoma brucei gambiense (strain MHOM/CI/86/DAL972) TaxID=679716 RepID=C9ZSZ7_TRYB9|nr:hypothetical protein, unlikely [Trypanosoma brucei gambiense DAL972]CBH12532.1 hypothetical protein, unlikely [Trypanosoma brucei gambiense DAL972]|eukprot:XP_011774812.1 hypothetical protein, unlikely [Trypanosoma brucei gambiense DAL972]